MGFPASGVFTLAEASGRRPVQHQLDAATHPGSRLGLLGPDRFEAFHDMRGVDVAAWSCPMIGRT